MSTTSIPGMEENFAKIELADWYDMGSPYDVNSAMQYSSHAFANRTSPTILTKDGQEIKFTVSSNTRK